MSVTKSTIESIFAAARTAFAGSNVEIRHNGRTYTGTRLPSDCGEIVDEAGALKTISGGVRLMASELSKPWPNVNDEISVKSAESSTWKTYIVANIRYDEMQATMLLTYAEQYDESGGI